MCQEVTRPRGSTWGLLGSRCKEPNLPRSTQGGPPACLPFTMARYLVCPPQGRGTSHVSPCGHGVAPSVTAEPPPVDPPSVPCGLGHGDSPSVSLNTCAHISEDRAGEMEFLGGQMVGRCPICYWRRVEK